MSPTIFLDTSPLGVVTKRKGIADAGDCRAWIADCRRAGCHIVVPAVARYKVARELLRLNNMTGLARLDAFCGIPGCYLPISDSALRLAAELWAQSRGRGTSTADPKELDCDVLICAQALDMGIASSDLVIATMNVGHLAQFVTAKLWTDIRP